MTTETRDTPHGLRAWLTDSSSLLVFQLIATGLATVTFLLIARGLGTETFGAFAAIFGLSLAASIFLDAGLGTFLLRELTLDRPAATQPTVLRSVLLLELRLTALATPITALATLAITRKGSLALLAALLITYVGFLTVATSIESVFRSARRVHVVGLAYVIEKLTALVLVTLIIVSGGGGLVAMGGALLASSVTRLVFDFLALRPNALVLLRGRDGEWGARTLVAKSLPFAATGLILAGIPRLDVTAVAGISASAAAYFAIGDRLVVGPLSLSAAFTQSLFPHFGRGANVVRRALIIQFGIGAVGAVVVAALARPLIGIALHHVEPRAVTTVRIMAIAIPFSFLSGGLLVQAYSRKLERATSLATLAASLIGTLAVVLGAVMFPPEGAALGYVGRQILICGSLSLLLAAQYAHSGDTAATESKI